MRYLGDARPRIEQVQAVDAPNVAHIGYRAWESGRTRAHGSSGLVDASIKGEPWQRWSGT
jgi:hypothetical protein